MKRKTKMQSYTSDYCMSAGDNAVSRKQIEASITTPASANEHSFRQEMMKGQNGSPSTYDRNAHEEPELLRQDSNLE
jgi:hypothetical protein